MTPISMSQSALNYVYFTLGYYPIFPNCLPKYNHMSIDSMSTNKKFFVLVYSPKSAAMNPFDLNKNILITYYTSTNSRHRSNATYWCEEVGL